MCDLTFAAGTAGVSAHGGGEATGAVAELLGLLPMLGIAALAIWYAVGLRRLWAGHGVGNGVALWRVATAATGVVVLVCSQLPPVDEAVESSFATHMVQHMILLMAVAPLLATGGFGLVLTMAMPRSARAGIARLRATGVLRWLRTPGPLAAAVGLAQAAVLLGWHLPVPYRAALDNDMVHLVEHASFVAAAWLLWAPIIGNGHRPFSGLAEVGVIFVAGVPAMALGALYTLAPAQLYPTEILAPDGGDPMAAQQLAGAVMWVPMNIVYLAISGVGLWQWLVRYDRRIAGDRDLPAPAVPGFGVAQPRLAGPSVLDAAQPRLVGPSPREARPPGGKGAP